MISDRARWRVGVAATVACACLLAPAAAQAKALRGTLSPRLAELAKPAVRALPPAAQARRLSLARSGPGSLLRRGNRVLARVRFEGGATAALGALREAGAQIVAVSRRYQTVTVAAKPGQLPAIAAVARVASVGEILAPVLYGASGNALWTPPYTSCEGGAMVSEGVGQLGVKEAREALGVDGSGVTVGVLSDSFNQAMENVEGTGPVPTHAKEDEESGDLPGALDPCAGQKTPVNVLEEYAPTPYEEEEEEATDEGRAMLQTVHDVAPGAKLAFATAYPSEEAFARNIERLAEPVARGGAGAQVIADDVGYFEEPFFQEGPVAAAVDKVANEGVSYFSAAGNDNVINLRGEEIASWEAPEFSGTACPEYAEEVLEIEECMNFDPEPGNPAQADPTFGFQVEAGATLFVDLQWAEPWYGVKTDLDAYLLNRWGEPLAYSEGNELEPVGSYGDNIKSQRPVEVFEWENTSDFAENVQLVINHCFGACNKDATSGLKPRLKIALLGDGAGLTETEYPVSAGEDEVGPTIFGHPAAQGAVGVAAVPFFSSEEPEEYSSRGPVTNYFGPVKGVVPGAALPGGGEIVAKPNVAATDCGRTTFFASFVAAEGLWRFCGTSAAAPHAAGVAALARQADPAASQAEIRAALEATANPVGSFGPAAVGAGLLDASAAVESLLPPTSLTITEHPPYRTGDSTPSFSFTSPGPAAFECSLDGAAPRSCSSPYKPPAPLSDGSHRFEVSAAGEGSAVDFFTVDTAAPTVRFTQKPPAFSAEPAPSFAFQASEEPATFSCAFDGETPRPCGSPYTPPALSDGAHQLRVVATDPLGNVGSAVDSFTVDTHPPVVTITSAPRALSAESRPTFDFIANESAAFACSLDHAASQPCASPFTVPARLADGPHSFTVTATDLAGNVGQASDSFTVDTRPPQTIIAKHPRHRVRTHHRKVRLNFRFRSNEAGVVFACQVDRGLQRFCGRHFSRRFGIGRHTLKVTARDPAGNVDPSPAVFHFRVKRVR